MNNQLLYEKQCGTQNVEIKINETKFIVMVQLPTQHATIDVFPKSS
jgi:hypothetical protein